jgi:hypothetical protein
VNSSRGIERLCRDHVIFITLSGDRFPHCSAIAASISCLGDLIGQVFKQVVLVCDAQRLSCRHLSAIGSGSLINAAEG